MVARKLFVNTKKTGERYAFARHFPEEITQSLPDCDLDL
ncbi:MAG: hypothetical protein RL097_677 [Candidatus Parcubacteria bacterium]